MKSGFGKIEIKVNKKIRLAGRENNRYSNGILDPLYARSIVIEDLKQNMVILLSLDLLFVGKKLSRIIKKKICRKYNINSINILISATHTHSAPKTWSNFLMELI